MILVVAKPTSENFIRNYTDTMEAQGIGKLLVTANPTKVLEISKDYDTIIFEWANDFTALCLDYPIEVGKKIIVRVHDHEVRKGRIYKINWSKVDKAWFINKQIQKIFHEYYPSVQSFFLPNAVDPAPFKENIVDNKKIGLLTLFCRTRKRIDRAIELMHYLKDDGWELHIRTEPNNPEPNGKSFNQLKELAKDLPVFWDLRPVIQSEYTVDKSDVNEFFADKAVVISTSEHEGFHMAIPESMYCGCMPCVFNWEFGQPRDFWRPFVSDSLEEMAEQIKAYQPSKKYRQYVLRKFSPKKLIPQLQKELAKIKKRQNEGII